MADATPGSGVKSNPVLMRRLSESKRAETVESPKKRSCVVWDEDNLRVNEQIKAELDCDKIPEPDTPFVRSPLAASDDEDEDTDGNAPIILDAAERVERLLRERKADMDAATKKGGFSAAADCTDSDAGTSGSHEELAAPEAFGSRFSDAEPTLSGAATDNMDESNQGRCDPYNDDWEEKALAEAGTRRMSNGEPQDLPSLSPSSGTSPTHGLSHQFQTSFETKRKQHYDFKNALAMGRQLLDEEDEDEEEEELYGQPPI